MPDVGPMISNVEPGPLRVNVPRLRFNEPPLPEDRFNTLAPEATSSPISVCEFVLPEAPVTCNVPPFKRTSDGLRMLLVGLPVVKSSA